VKAVKKPKAVKLPSKPKFVVDEKCPRCGSAKVVVPVEIEQDDQGLWIAYQELCENQACDFCKIYKVKFYPSTERVFIC
jgi:formate dehydrogenase maturation protein FdhE